MKTQFKYLATIIHFCCYSGMEGDGRHGTTGSQITQHMHFPY